MDGVCQPEAVFLAIGHLLGQTPASSPLERVSSSGACDPRNLAGCLRLIRVLRAAPGHSSKATPIRV